MSSHIWHWFISTPSPVNNSAKSMTKYNDGTQEVKPFNGVRLRLSNQTSRPEPNLVRLTTVTCPPWCRWRRRRWRLWCLRGPGSWPGNTPPASQSPPWPCPSPPATFQPDVSEMYFGSEAARWLLTSAMRSPSPILSPSFFSQRAIVPVCIVGDSAGSSTWWSEVGKLVGRISHHDVNRRSTWHRLEANKVKFCNKAINAVWWLLTHCQPIGMFIGWLTKNRWP